MQTPRDLATDLAVALVLGAGVAGCLGLVLGGLEVFRPLPVALAGGAGMAFALRAMRTGSRDGDAPPTRSGRLASLRTVDGVLVFLLALALYAPGYDTTLYGADATTYLGSATYLARHGAFRIDAPLLHQLPTVNAAGWQFLFPAYNPYDPATRSRSVAGLAFDIGTRGGVYSTFAKLPSVWLALGFAAAGVPGAVFMSPLLGACGTMAYYLFLRRTLGTFVALVAAGLLATCIPQLVFARVSMGEIGGQFFLWGGLLALSRWYESRAPVAAVAGGVGLGCAMLARAEFLIFIPLTAVIAWTLGRLREIPLLAVAPAAGLGAVALALLVSLPTHYRAAVNQTLRTDLGGFAVTVAQRPGTMAALLVAAVGVAVVGALRLGAGSDRPRWLRAVVGVGVGLWAFAYVLQSTPPTFGGARLLPHYVTWIVLAASVVGLPVLGYRLRGDGAGLLALLIGAVAAGHFLYDAHVLLLPLWGGRRLVPAVLPLLFAAAAVAIAWPRTWPRQLGRRLGAVLAVAVVLSNAMRSRILWHKPFLRGSEAAVTALVRVIPEPDALVVLDPALFGALLDVPLWLLHGREAVQLPGTAGTIDVVPVLAVDMARIARPMYLVQHLLLPPPNRTGVVFTEVATGVYPILALDTSDPPRNAALAVRVFRVEVPAIKLPKQV